MSMELSFSATDRVFVIAPHPDDESLGCGGLIQRALAAGAELNVLFITDGDNNPWPQRYLEFRWNIGEKERERWGKRRRLEAIDALVKLGAPPDCANFLSLPDQGLTNLLSSDAEQLLEPFTHTLENWRPTYIIAPCIEDVHPDHCAIHVALRYVLQSDVSLSPEVLFYCIHGNGIPISTPRCALVLTKEELAAKRKAILAHHTQMALSKKRFLQYASPAEAYYRLAEETTPTTFHSAVIRDGELILRLHPHVVLRRRANLLFSWSDDEGRFRMAKVSLRNTRILQTPTGPEIHLKAPPFSPEKTIYAKYQLKRIYFEQYGWQTLAFLHTSSVSSQRPSPVSAAV